MSDTADKRSVTTDALTTLGTIIDHWQKRDAIHLAVEPVVAGEVLDPGDHITVQSGVAYRTKVGKGLGIVDPFLAEEVEKGQWFWFIMYPRQVRSLRHVWSHPAFPDELPVVATTPVPNVISPVAQAKERIKGIAEALGSDDNGPMTYERLMAAAKDWVDFESYHTEHGSESWRDAFTAYKEAFWDAYQIVTGTSIDEDKRSSFFTCSC